MVSGELRTGRTKAWIDALEVHPDTHLFCWRGGLRSTLAQQWLLAEGKRVRRVEGGFKALRGIALDAIEAMGRRPMVVVSGRTGVGKTEVMRGLPGVIDLEALAVHRGSAFGVRDRPQPTPISFESSLARVFLRTDVERLIVEDESRTIGRLAVPLPLREAMKVAPIVVVEAEMAERVAHIRREYVDEALDAGLTAAQLHERYAAALGQVRDRLGGANEQRIRRDLDTAFTEHGRTGIGQHDRWIEGLLRCYYDPMYDYQLAKKQDRLCFSGDRGQVRNFLSPAAP